MCPALVVDFLGLRWNGSSSWFINQAQDLLEQASWHGKLGPANGTVKPRVSAQPGIRGNSRTATFQLQAVVEINPQGGYSGLTRRVTRDTLAIMCVLI